MAILSALTASRSFFSTVFLIMASGLLLPTTVAAGTRSKSAFNQTQNINATAAAANAGDIIVYTLSYSNNSTVTETISLEDDITDVLYSAELLDSGGGSLWGSTLRFPAATVPANSRGDRIFKVRVKALPSTTLDTLMSNSFGNGVDVRIRVLGSTASGTVKGVYTAPQTGSSEWVTAGFASLSVLGYYIFSRIRLRSKHGT